MLSSSAVTVKALAALVRCPRHRLHKAHLSVRLRPSLQSSLIQRIHPSNANANDIASITRPIPPSFLLSCHRRPWPKTWPTHLLLLSSSLQVKAAQTLAAETSAPLDTYFFAPTLGPNTHPLSCRALSLASNGQPPFSTITADQPASHDSLAHHRPSAFHHSRSFNSCGSVSSRRDDACDQHRPRPRHVGSGGGPAKVVAASSQPLPFTRARPQPHFISPSHHPSPHLHVRSAPSSSLQPSDQRFSFPQTRRVETWPPSQNDLFHIAACPRPSRLTSNRSARAS
ncbi:hypothetical protein BC567DRAFT_77424 [Phyllosticta citribraziliensis]